MILFKIVYSNYLVIKLANKAFLYKNLNDHKRGKVDDGDR